MPVIYPTITSIGGDVLVVTRYQDDNPVAGQVTLGANTAYWVNHLVRSHLDAFEAGKAEVRLPPKQHKYVGEEFRDEDGEVVTVQAVVPTDTHGTVVLFADGQGELVALPKDQFDDNFSQYEEVEVEVQATYRIRETWTVQAPPNARDSELQELVEQARDNGDEPDDIDWDSADFQDIERVSRA